jgi:hypothetical protein
MKTAKANALSESSKKDLAKSNHNVLDLEQQYLNTGMVGKVPVRSNTPIQV